MPERLTVPRSEFEARCAATMEEAGRRGLDAVLVWSRGGGPVDGAADVLYLTDHYTLFPTIPDVPGEWAGRGYTAALLTDGDVWLAVDVLEVSEDDVFCTHLLHVSDLVREIAAAMRKAGVDRGRVGLIGGDVMSRAQAVGLQNELPYLELQPADDILRRMRMRKGPAEEVLIRQSCSVGSRAAGVMLSMLEPGRTEAEIVSKGIASVVERGAAIYNTFADTYGPSWTNRGRHRMPTYSATQQLQDGDIFTIDMSGTVSGYLFDLSRSAIVGVAPSSEGQRLLDVTRGAVRRVIEGLRPGATVGVAVRAGLDELDRAGFGSAASDFAAFGHGLGLGWEDPWLLPHNETVVEAGMYLAVEKAIWDGNLGASYEDDVFILEDGPEILTIVDGDLV